MWPEQFQTDELLAKAKDGDDLAVNLLMDRHRNALRQLVRMRLDRKIQRRVDVSDVCLLYTSPSPRDQRGSRMPSSA